MGEVASPNPARGKSTEIAVELHEGAKKTRGSQPRIHRLR